MSETERDSLARAWDAVADRYDAYFGPRFEPWIAEAIGELRARAVRLPAGHVLVPCCGPGRELVMLGDALPGRRVVGVDLSPGMIAAARKRTAARRR